MPVADAVRREGRGLAAAIAFQTRIPVGRGLALGPDDVRRATATLPLVGAAVGAAVAATALGLNRSLPPLLAAALAVAVGAILTGALHLDALADTADAIGAQTRERALEIMRDHAVGAFGATALALDLLVKAAALAALVTLQGDRDLVVAVVSAGALSRAVGVAIAASLAPVRRDGLAPAVADSSRARALIGVAVAAGIAVGLGGSDGAILVAAAAGSGVVAAAACRRWLGGVTGDTLGAAIELSETVLLVVAVASMR